VRLTWTRIAQNENHKEVYALANEMLERVGKFMEKYVELGSRLEAAAKSYSQGYDKLKDGGHSIPGTCRKLIKMGAKMEKRRNVPESLLGLDDKMTDDDKIIDS
ncbi:MAG: DNA recombination protein RmuC, partial [Muribaculaceae bacterium]|nr:DNA recombination protein RmuC [Muribaculaceae bacterium]